MKTRWMVGVMAAGMAARAFGAGPQVTAYSSCDPAVPMLVLQRAQLVASRLFAEVGITVRWQTGRPRVPEGQGETESVVIRLEAGIPTGPHAHALAFTTPEQGGVVIHVFYSKISAAYRPDRADVLLGYVLAHEMGHVLQGMTRHSDDGVMKAFWTVEDYSEMSAGRLEFAPDDAKIMLRRLKALADQAAEASPKAVLRLDAFPTIRVDSAA